MIKLVLMAVFMLLCIFSGLAAEAFFKSRAAVINDFLSFIRYAKRETSKVLWKNIPPAVNSKQYSIKR